jgi:hypothetical protein
MSPNLKNKSPKVPSGKKREGDKQRTKSIQGGGETHSSSSDFGFKHLVYAFRGCCLRVLEGLVKPLSFVGVRWCLVLTLSQPRFILPFIYTRILFTWIAYCCGKFWDLS